MQRTVILVILTLVWAAVLIPHHLANRAASRPADSIRAFRTQLRVLGRTAPVTASQGTRSTGPGGVHAMCRRHRRQALFVLLAASAATLVLGFAPGLGALHALHLVVDLVLVSYVAWLVRLRTLAESRAATVRYLRPRRPSRAPADSMHPVFLLQRTSA